MTLPNFKLKIVAKETTCADATAVLKDTANNTILTEAIPSGATENITAPDATVTLNGGAFQTPRSGQSIDVTTVDQNGVAFAPTVAGLQLSFNRYDEIDLYMAKIGSSDASIRAALRVHKQDLITAGIWNKAYTINPFLGGSAALNIFKLVGGTPMSFFGTVTHSSTGVKGNGVNGGYKCKISLDGIAQNANSVFLYLRDNINGSSTRDIGANDGGGTGLFIGARDTDLARYRNYQGTPSTIANTDSRGVFGISRSASGSFLYQIRATQGSITQASSGVTTAERWDIYGMCVNASGTASLFSANEHAYLWVGGALNGSEMNALTNSINTLMTALGRNV